MKKCFVVWGVILIVLLISQMATAENTPTYTVHLSQDEILIRPGEETFILVSLYADEQPVLETELLLAAYSSYSPVAEVTMLDPSGRFSSAGAVLRIQGLTSGTATITAILSTGESADCLVTVREDSIVEDPEYTEVTTYPQRISIFPEDQVTISVVVSGQNITSFEPPTVFLNSNNLSVASAKSTDHWTDESDGIVGQFEVTGHSAGEAVLTFTLRNGENATVEVKVADGTVFETAHYANACLEVPSEIDLAMDASIPITVFLSGLDAEEDDTGLSLSVKSESPNIVDAHIMDARNPFVDGKARLIIEGKEKGSSLLQLTLSNGYTTECRVNVEPDDIFFVDTLDLFASANYYNVPFVYSQGKYLNKTATIHFYIQNNTVVGADSDIGQVDENCTAKVTEVLVSLPPNLVLDTQNADEPVYSFHITNPIEVGVHQSWGIMFDVSILSNSMIETIPITVEINGDNFPTISRILLLPVYDAESVYTGNARNEDSDAIDDWRIEHERFQAQLGRHELYATNTFDFLFATKEEKENGNRAIFNLLSNWLALSNLTDVPFGDGSYMVVGVPSTRYGRHVELVFLSRRIGEGNDTRYEFAWYAMDVPPYNTPIPFFGVHQQLLDTYLTGLVKQFDGLSERIGKVLAASLVMDEASFADELSADALLLLANRLVGDAAIEPENQFYVLSLGDMSIPIP